MCVGSTREGAKIQVNWKSHQKCTDPMQEFILEIVIKLKFQEEWKHRRKQNLGIKQWEKRICSSPGRLWNCSTCTSYHFIIISLPGSSPGLLEILNTVPDKSSRANFGTPGLGRDQWWTVSQDRGWNPISHSDNFPSRRISPGTKTPHRVNPLSRAQARQQGSCPRAVWEVILWGSLEIKLATKVRHWETTNQAKKNNWGGGRIPTLYKNRNIAFILFWSCSPKRSRQLSQCFPLLPL